MKKENILVVALICIAVFGTIVYKNIQTGSFKTSQTKEGVKENDPQKAILWQDFKPGIKMAAEQNKPVFLYFYADWCTYCTKLKKTTFKNKNVLEFINSQFISIRVNTDVEKDLAVNWKVRGLPTSWFLEPDGTRINSIPGYMDEKQFLSILKYIQSRRYKEMTLHEFIKTL